MSEIPAEQTQTNLEVAETSTASSISFVENVKMSVGNFFNSWKFKLGLAVAAVFGVLLLWFFWEHIVADIGMKSWAARSGAQPVECMLRDTNGDEYVSCSALLDQQVVPLQCSSSLFNIGCRVNYGTAAPNLRLLNPKASNS
jgi:hypothetical protein